MREIVFGEDGLPRQMIEVRPEGRNSTDVTYKEVDGKFLMSLIVVQTPGGAAKIAFEHEKSGKFWLLTREVITVEMMGLEIVFAVSDYKVNALAATPAEPTPATPEGGD